MVPNGLCAPFFPENVSSGTFSQFTRGQLLTITLLKATLHAPQGNLVLQKIHRIYESIANIVNPSRPKLAQDSESIKYECCSDQGQADADTLLIIEDSIQDLAAKVSAICYSAMQAYGNLKNETL